jgi:hypothetical protein
MPCAPQVVDAAHSLDDGLASVGKEISAFNKVDIALSTLANILG